MKNTFLPAFTVAALLALWAPSHAQTAATPSNPIPVAVIDAQRVLHESVAGKKADAFIGDLRGKYQQEIAKTEEQLRAEDQELGRQRSLLSPEAFEARRHEFERKVQESQRLVQERNGAFDATVRQARAEIGKVVITVVTEMMQKKNILLVIDRAQIVASQTSIDLTEQVLAEVNKRLPSIPLSVPSGAAVRNQNQNQAPPKKAAPAKK